MGTEVILFDEWAKQRVVEALSNAVGDDLLESIRKSELSEKHSNSKKFLTWDLINRNFIKMFAGSGIVAEYANRGPWHMVPLVDKDSGVVYSVMRQDRFEELKRKKGKRPKAHYIDAFVQMFNFDITDRKQLSFFESQYPDEEVANIVQSVLQCLNVACGTIKRHAIILFEEYNHELINVHCCLVNTDLTIVAEENWNEYIKHEQSLIIEQVEDKAKEQNEVVKPTLGKKARARKEKNVKIASKDGFNKEAK